VFFKASCSFSFSVGALGHDSLTVALVNAMWRRYLRGNRSDHTVGCKLKKVIDCNCTIAIFLLLAAEACFTNYSVVYVEICNTKKIHYHINLVGILFLCEDAFELLTDENVVMFGLIMSKLNSVRIGKLRACLRTWPSMA